MSSKRNPEARNDWRTPPEIIERVRQIEPIVLDPATTKDNPVGAVFIRTAQCDPDGLATNWRERADGGLVYVNPPYQTAWYSKIKAEMIRGTHLTALLMAKPGTNWFQDLAELSHRCLFWRGRLHFSGQGPAGFDSALLYHGPYPGRFAKAFSGCGWIV